MNIGPQTKQVHHWSGKEFVSGETIYFLAFGGRQ
jgi:hypothetical protein